MRRARHQRERRPANEMRIVREAHDEAVQLLSEHRHRLDVLARVLFQAETLEGPAAYAVAGLEPPNDDATPASKRGRIAVEPIHA